MASFAYVSEMTKLMAPHDSTESKIARAKAGDREAFDELTGELRPKLLGFARVRLGPDLRARIEPEDVVQDAFVRAFQSIDRFEWRGPNSLFNWIATILEFRVRDLSRVGKRGAPRRLAIDPAADNVSASRDARREERFQRLEKAVAILSEDHRQVVRLISLEQLSFVEAGKRLGRSSGAVRQLFLRALGKLRESFGPETESLCLPERDLDIPEGGSDA